MRILLIEDEQDIVDLLKTNLGEEGFIVDNAIDGEEGSYLARVNDYDLIVLDNIMPKKNGKEVCEDIRQSGKNTPIIMLSVENKTNTKIDLLNTGADDYLTKPFSFEELVARIRALLRRPHIIESEVLEIDDLIIDVKKNFVKRGSKEIRLRRKEFLLLEYMMRNQGAVLSRGVIMEHVWDTNTDPFSNTIETHILNLRNKIDTKGKKKLIHTVPGRGYKINIYD